MIVLGDIKSHVRGDGGGIREMLFTCICSRLFGETFKLSVPVLLHVPTPFEPFTFTLSPQHDGLSSHDHALTSDPLSFKIRAGAMAKGGLDT